jgi:hypothetical protein
MAEWRPITGFDGYEVSNEGQVRFIGGWRKFGSSRRLAKPSIRALQQHSNGYLQLRILRKNVFIHRLVAEAFIPREFGRDCINHKNGRKTDNRADNLEWVAAYENLLHARRELKKNWSTKRKLSWSEVCEIRSSDESNYAIAKRFDVSATSISNIRSLKRRSVG